MTALSTRDALARTLCAALVEAPLDEPCNGCQAQADALIASGVVVDVATLADDEALMQAWARAEYGDLRSAAALAAGVKLMLPHARSLAAVLAERAS